MSEPAAALKQDMVSRDMNDVAKPPRLLVTFCLCAARLPGCELTFH